MQVERKSPKNVEKKPIAFGAKNEKRKKRDNSALTASGDNNNSLYLNLGSQHRLICLRGSSSLLFVYEANLIYALVPLLLLLFCFFVFFCVYCVLFGLGCFF